MTPLAKSERRDALIRIRSDLGRQRLEALRAEADVLASLIASALVEADAQLNEAQANAGMAPVSVAR
jgi:hypothetical protein